VEAESKEAAMAGQIVTTKDAPQSPLYAQGIRVGAQIWVSGMTGLDPASGQMAGSTIQEQTEQALTNCERIIEAGGGTRDDIVEVGVLLAHPDDFAGLNEAYAEHFSERAPTRYVARLGPDLPDVLVSIRMTAVIG
jgi:2-iminobutanoate/2-iminopropanoate deaminase